MSWDSDTANKHHSKHIKPPTLTPATSPTPASTSTKVPSKVTATHQSTSHLTQAIHLHTFYLRPASTLRWSPSQHIELQLPPDLDLIGGRADLDDERRRLALTPCRYSYISNASKTSSDADSVDSDGAMTSEVEVQFVTRTGSLTSQIGLPRFRALEAAVLGCGGGFPVGGSGHGNGSGNGGCGAVRAAVAGGVGICAFLATSVSANEPDPLSPWRDEKEDHIERPMLFWTLHVDDWEFVRYAIERELLVVGAWGGMHVFLTSGTEMIAHERVEQLTEAARKLFGGDEKLEIHFRRMQAGDLLRATESKTTRAPCHSEMTQVKTTPTTIRFCGRKALEWQIKLWARDMKPPAAVHTTQMQK